MSVRRGWAALLFIGVMCLASSAAAHLMSSGHGTMNVVKGKAYIVVSLPIAVFAHSDAAGAVQDGVLTAAELKTQEKALRAAVRAGLHVKAGGQAARFSSILLNLPQGDGHTPGQGADLVVMIVAQLGAAPQGADPSSANPQPIAVSSTLWAKGAETLKIKATVTEGRRTTHTEVVDLTVKAPAHVFFAKPALKAKPKTHTHGRSKPHSH